MKSSKTQKISRGTGKSSICNSLLAEAEKVQRGSRGIEGKEKGRMVVFKRVDLGGTQREIGKSRFWRRN